MSDSSAMHAAYVALLLALHEKKVIHINDVIHQLEGTHDFGRLTNMKQGDQYLDALIANLKEIAAALARSGQ